MEYGVFGSTGLQVSPIALGTSRWTGSTAKRDGLAVMDLAIDRGINLIDTSNSYSSGDCETIVGKGLKGRRHRVVLATKVCSRVDGSHANVSGLSRTHIMEQVEASLKRLKTDYIDLY